MRRTETLKLGDNSVTLRELTVGEVRGMLLSRPEQDTVDYLLFDDITLGELMQMTDLSKETIDNLTQSELDTVRVKAKELNPHFFAMLNRIKELNPT
ncbi:MAG: hypothetical protein JSU84_06950 [Thiotrichales bacterium]|nr:MAG: hypothetical protein JSU84_06950 [Thiotrichales bacterium]